MVNYAIQFRLHRDTLSLVVLACNRFHNPRNTSGLIVVGLLFVIVVLPVSKAAAADCSIE